MVQAVDKSNPQPAWARTLVRYVDERQAVIDTHVFVRRAALSDVGRRDRGKPLDVLVRLESADGQVLEKRTTIEPDSDSGLLRLDLSDPRRWWPAGMGEQALYTVTITLLLADQPLARWESVIGLTSVRPGATDNEQPVLLVNGRPCSIHAVVPVRPVDEQQLLAVGPDSLLLVSDHFAPDVLCEAADRAGILLVQSVPAPEVDPRADLRAQVDRLCGHPSLAGWLVSRAGDIGDHLVEAIRKLDPTRSVFRRLPVAG